MLVVNWQLAKKVEYVWPLLLGQTNPIWLFQLINTDWISISLISKGINDIKYTNQLFCSYCRRLSR